MRINLDSKEILLTLFYILASFLTLFLELDYGVDKMMLYKWCPAMILTISCCSIVVLKRKTYVVDKLEIAMLSFLIYLIIRTLFSENISLNCITIFLFWIFYFVAQYHGNKVIPMVFVAACALQAIYGLLQYFGICYTTAQSGIVGNFDNAAGFAASLSICYPLGFLVFKEGGKTMIFGILSLLIIATAIVLSDSRAGMLVVVVTTSIYLFGLLKKVKRIYIVSTLSVFAALCLFLFYYKIESVYGRLLIWKVSLKLAAENLIFGGGYGSFKANYMARQADYFANHPDSVYSQLADNVSRPFNEYLLLFVEYGIVGIILLALLLFYIFRKQSIVHPYILCIISLMIFALFSYPLHYPFVLLVIAYCLGRLPKKEFVRRFRISPFVSILLCFTMGITIVFPLALMKFDTEWYEVTSQAYFGKREGLIDRYDFLYSTRRDNSRFLYNYAVELERDGESERSIEMMFICRKRMNDYDVNLFMGEFYLKNNKLDAAEIYYKVASNMVPNRFLPLGRLLTIYQMTGETEQALKMANSIVAKEVKIPSARVSEVIIQAKQFLEKEDLK